MSDTSPPTPDLRHLTAQIVAAYVSKAGMTAETLPGLIHAVHQALSNAGAPTAKAEAPRPEPAVPIKKSVFPDHIVCLEDGKTFKTLRRHLQNTYGMTPDQYRKRWDLPPDYPMVAPAYAEQRSALAKSFGLGRAKGAKANADDAGATRKAGRKAGEAADE